jgi:hypothetical protein
MYSENKGQRVLDSTRIATMIEENLALKRKLAETETDLANSKVFANNETRKRQRSFVDRAAADAKRWKVQEMGKATEEKLATSKQQLQAATQQVERERQRVLELEQGLVNAEVERLKQIEYATILENELREAKKHASVATTREQVAHEQAETARKTIAELVIKNKSATKMGKEEKKRANELMKHARKEKRKAVNAEREAGEVQKEMKRTAKLLTAAKNEIARHGSGCGGLLKYLMSDEWHNLRRNKRMALHLFGFSTWLQVKIDADCSFPDEFFLLCTPPWDCLLNTP